MPETRTKGARPHPPRLLDRLRSAISARNYSPRTAEAYVFWTRKFILFHGKRHPDSMGEAEIKSFITYLAISRKVAASTQNQALGALLFLYRVVLGRALDAPNELIRARRATRLPVVLSPREVSAVFQHLRGPALLAAALMYGSGLRLMECLRLRVQDIDFDRKEIVVREGKGRKDRHTLLPEPLAATLREHLARLHAQHNIALQSGAGAVTVPEAVARRSPASAFDWSWQWIFPAARRPIRSTELGGRQHLHKTVIQRAFTQAVRSSGVTKSASCHSLRHSFATHLVESGTNIRAIQELLGHNDVSTTMIYTSVLHRRGQTVRSPIDAICTPAFLSQSLSLRK